MSLDVGHRTSDVGRGQSGVVLLANVRFLSRHPLLVALAVIGIALGVGMATAIDLAIASSRRAFAESVAGVAGRATHQIVAGPSGIPDADYLRIRRAVAPAATAPVVECDVALPAHPGRVLRLTGVDPLAEAPFRPYLGAFSSDGAGVAVAQLMTVPDAVVLLDETARALGVAPGMDLTVRIGTRTHALHVVALITAKGVSRRALADIAIVDISSAQELLGRVGRIDRIDLILGADAPDPATIGLPPGAEVTTAGSRTAALDQMTRAFHLNLTALSLIALVVGMFLIYNTVSFLMVRRRELIGRLRLAGATRGQIASAVLGEAALLGAVGTTIGLLGGIIAAHALVGQVTRTVSDLYFVVSVRDVALPPMHLALLAAMGMASTFAATAIPAWEATRTRPSAVLGRSLLEARARSLAPWLAVVGLAVLGVALGFICLSGRSIGGGFAALGTVIIGYSLMIPAAVMVGSAALRGPAAIIGGPLGAMAVRSVAATLSRTGVAVAALVIASAASLGVGIMVGSFRSALVVWLDTTLRADVYISAPRSVAARMDAVPLSDDLIARLRAAPGVATVITKRDAHPITPHGRIDLVAFDIPEVMRDSFHFLAGDPVSGWTGFVSGAVLITEPFAFRHAVAVGGSVRMRTDRGDHDFLVVGVLRDYSNDRGQVFLDRRVYEQWWDDRGVSAVSVLAAQGTDADELMASLRLAAGGDALSMSSSSSLRQDSLTVFDRTFAITGIIRLLAGVVAFLGILGALLSLALERSREMGLLRMYGCTPRQVAALIVTQATVTGTLAGALAVPLGIALSTVLSSVINRRSFGWTFELQVDPWMCAQAVGLALAAAVAASLYPAWRMGRASPASVLRNE
ncbi:MAG: ABC transporter permease [Planctomycetes bacterium]|nr:ABC transporter permease [Planctomycetota bacterium]